MRKNRFFFAICVSSLIILLAISQPVSADTSSVVETLDESPVLVGATVLAIYEAVVRIIPTKSNNSILNFIFKFLHKFSEWFDVKK